ncbi:MAG TPA: XdhC family protein [Ignavibacteria bacterium]|nr:XdhC family protein [Ignavibacteria bacterium]
MTDLYNEILIASKSNIKAAICTIINTKGSAPRKKGAKMLVYSDGSIKGTIGGGNLEKKVISEAIEVINKQEPSTFKHDLLHQHGMCCGGAVEIFIEPVMKIKKLFIFGAGHTGHALAKFANDTGFDVYLVDDRKEYIDQCNVDEINKMNLEHTAALQALPFDKNTYVVITTYSHQIDRDILAYCVKQDWAYLGMIGSKRKVHMTKKMFIESNIGTEEELNKINMPIGIDINAETPEEIAISILAELIKVKNSTD